MKCVTTTLSVAVWIGLACGAGMFAQSVSQISGTVKDVSGHGEPAAQVTVTQTDTGVTRTTAT